MPKALHKASPVVDIFGCSRNMTIAKQGLLHKVHFAHPLEQSWIRGVIQIQHVIYVLWIGEVGEGRR